MSIDIHTFAGFNGTTFLWLVWLCWEVRGMVGLINHSPILQLRKGLWKDLDSHPRLAHLPRVKSNQTKAKEISSHFRFEDRFLLYRAFIAPFTHVYVTWFVVIHVLERFGY